MLNSIDTPGDKEDPLVKERRLKKRDLIRKAKARLAGGDGEQGPGKDNQDEVKEKVKDGLSAKYDFG